MGKIITQSDYTRTLINKRNDLADNIDSKGVEAERNEKLNTLVPKVLEIPSGSAFCLDMAGDVFDADTFMLSFLEVTGTITEG